MGRSGVQETGRLFSSFRFVNRVKNNGTRAMLALASVLFSFMGVSGGSSVFGPLLAPPIRGSTLVLQIQNH